jgi:hypothetical protein
MIGPRIPAPLPVYALHNPLLLREDKIYEYLEISLLGID